MSENKEVIDDFFWINDSFSGNNIGSRHGIFHEGIVPENQQLRIEELKNLDYSEISWLFDLLDQEFLQLKEDLEMLSLNYVLNHKEAFM